MLRLQYLLSDGQGLLQQWFCLCILSTFIEIHTRVMEKASRFWKCEFPLFNEVCADLSVWKAPLAALPRSKFDLWKSAIDCANSPLRPQSLCRLIQLVFQDNLQQAMNRYCFYGRMTPDK